MESTHSDNILDWETENKKLIEDGRIRKDDDGYYSVGYLSDDGLIDVLFDLSCLMRLVVDINKVNSLYLDERYRGLNAPAPGQGIYEGFGLNLNKEEIYEVPGLEPIKAENLVSASMYFVLSESMFSVLEEVSAVEAIETKDLRLPHPYPAFAQSSLRRISGKEIKANTWYLPVQKDYIEKLEDDIGYPLLGIFTQTQIQGDMASCDRMYFDASSDWLDKFLTVNLPDLEVFFSSHYPQIGASNDYAALWLALLDLFNKSRVLHCDYCGEFVESSAHKRTQACQKCTKTRQRYLKYKDMAAKNEKSPRKNVKPKKRFLKRAALG